MAKKPINNKSEEIEVNENTEDFNGEVIVADSVDSPKNVFSEMNNKLQAVWSQYWEVRKVVNMKDPLQNKKALELEAGYRCIVQANEALQEAQKA